MTQAFRDQVGRIRERDDAVAVLCVDAVDVGGSLIRTLRNYVGGNPVLLAVTRCDLLPSYATENFDGRQRRRMERYFLRAAAELRPAGVYFCSVGDDGEDGAFDGSRELADDLLNDLGDRDAYVVGVANIGKSTLTDRLIEDIVQLHSSEAVERHERRWSRLSKKQKAKKQRARRYRAKTGSEMDRRRYEAVRRSRVTKSSLPGTTLQNIRIPCFPGHKQALWDTPGLLLDTAAKHFPIRDLRGIRAQRPRRIEPRWHDDPGGRAVALLVSEGGGTASIEDGIPVLRLAPIGDESDFENVKEMTDEERVPLLRIEIRLKRSDRAGDDPEPPRLVWNSLLHGVLTTDVVGIDEASSEERRRAESVGEARARADAWAKERRLIYRNAVDESDWKITTKEERRQRYEEWRRARIAEVGGERKWDLLEKEIRRRNVLVEFRGRPLEMVLEEVVPARAAREVDVDRVGSMGIVSPSADALVRVFAPSTGVRPVCRPMMAVPPHWEGLVEDDDLADDGDDDDDESDSECEDGFHEFGMGTGGIDREEWDEWNEYDRGPERRRDPPGEDRQKRWAELSGDAVGWKFHEKPHFVRGTFVDGWQKIEEHEKDSKRRDNFSA